MSEHQRETDFLRRIIRYDESAERDKLKEAITRTQRDAYCLRRAVSLMALLSAVAITSLYSAPIFLTDFPEEQMGFFNQCR